MLGRFDCLSSWRQEFSTGLSPPLVPGPEGSRGVGGGGRGWLGLAVAPRASSSRGPATGAPRTPAPGGRSACAAGAQPGLRRRGWGAGRPSAPSFGGSPQADDTALPPGRAPQSVGLRVRRGVAPNGPGAAAEGGAGGRAPARVSAGSRPGRPSRPRPRCKQS